MCPKLFRMQYVFTARLHGSVATPATLSSWNWVALSQFGCEYLFGVTIDGRLNLRDAYVMDNETGVYAQPNIAPEVPYEPHHYQELPWSETFFGDSMMQKEPWEKVRPLPVLCR